VSDVLARMAEELVADLVITGRRGRGDLVELVGGSVSQDMIHRAHCPVVVVPADSERRR
jgi:nucleotide-binding universal stress UspA family protein